MSSGRYTAYHIYQGLQFSEAQKAGTMPYKMPEYQCAHSQRGYHFQFDNMVERTHFDAANTSCCNEPVMNFANKPQYAESSKPMNPQDCGAKVSSTGCNVLEVRVESATSLCAGEAAKIQRIRIGCAELCPELAAKAGGGTIKGQYGDFRVLGSEPGSIMVLEYTPDADKMSGWFDYCSGAQAITEPICSGHSLSYYLQGALDFPGGCGCDCCGNNGGMTAPQMTIDAPSSLTADWSNTVEMNQMVSGEACSGGSITGTFEASGLGGSESVQFEEQSVYTGYGNSVRSVSRGPATVGSAQRPACCGGQVTWDGEDGCNGAAIPATTAVTGMLAASDLYVNPSPDNGDTLHPGTSYMVSGWQACSYSQSASFDSSGSCISFYLNSGQSSDGKLYAPLQSLQLTDTFSCSGCCGDGTLQIIFHNGCGTGISGDYLVRHNYTDASLIGYIYRCEAYGNAYKVEREKLYCDGTSGVDTIPELKIGYTTGECVALISGVTAECISGLLGCGNTALSGSSQCCWYWDNNESDLDFRSRIFAVSGDTCCSIDTESGAWVNSGSGSLCCPQGG